MERVFEQLLELVRPFLLQLGLPETLVDVLASLARSVARSLRCV